MTDAGSVSYTHLALGTREIDPEGRSRARDHEGTRGGARGLDQIRAPLGARSYGNGYRTALSRRQGENILE